MQTPNSRITFALLCFLLLPCGYGFSQSSVTYRNYTITKDHVACLYGLKNDSGRWVIPPTYTGMGTTNMGYFLVEVGEKKGLLDSSGKVLISPVYEWLDMAWPQWQVCMAGYSGECFDRYYRRKAGTNEVNDKFIVRLNGKFGLLDRNGKVKIPMEWNSMQGDSDGLIIVSRNKHSENFLLDTNGTVLFKTGAALPDRFRGKPVTKIARMKGCKMYYGALDKKGNIILPPEYSQVFFHYRLIVAQKKGREFIFDSHGREQLPFAYMKSRRSWPEERYYHSPIDHSDSGTVFSVQRNRHRFYLVRNMGDSVELLPETYSRIVPLGVTPFIAQVWQNNHTGIIDAKGHVLVPITQDSIRAEQLMCSRSANQSRTFFLAVTKDRHLGLFSDSGKVLLPPVYESFCSTYRDYEGLFAFYRKDELVLFTAYNGKYDKPYVKLLTQLNDSCWLYYYGDRKQLILQKKKDNSLFIETRKWDDISGKTLAVVRNASQFYILGPGMKLFLAPEKIKNAQANEKDKTLRVETPQGHCGLLDLNTGEWLLDTVYADIENRTPKMDYYWVKTDTSTNCHCPAAQRSYMIKEKGEEKTKIAHQQKTCNWFLISKADHKRVCPIDFAIPFNLSPATRPVWTNDGAAFFNVRQMRLFSDEHYLDILQLSPNIYALRDTSGKLHITGNTGLELDRRKWNYVVPISSTYPGGQRWGSEQARTRLWLLSGDEGFAVLDSDSHFTTNMLQVDSMRRWAMFSNKGRLGGPSVSYEMSDRIRESLFDAAGKILAHFDAQDQPAMAFGYGSFLNSNSGRYPYSGFTIERPVFDVNLQMKERYQYNLFYAGPLAYSLSISNEDWPVRFGSGQRDYFSYRKTARGYELVKISDIVSDNTQQIFNDLLLEAIREDQRLKIGCTDNSRLYAMTKGRFTLSAEGLVFYFRQDESISYSDVDVLISWEKLKPFAKPGSIVFDFAK